MKRVGIAIAIAMTSSAAFAEPINGSSIAAGLGTLNVDYETMDGPDSSAYFAFDATQFVTDSVFLSVGYTRGIESWEGDTSEMTFVTSAFDIVAGYEYPLSGSIAVYGQGGWLRKAGELTIAENGNENTSDQAASGLTLGAGLTFSTPIRVRGSIGANYESLEWEESGESDTEVAYTALLGYDVTDAFYVAGFADLVPGDSSAYAIGLGYRY